jgi:hypothetical protein
MQLPPVEKNVSGYYFNGGEYNTIHRNCYFCVLSEVKRQDNIEFIELLKRVRMSMHTKDDIKYIKNMENNEVNECDFPIYMCAVNKKVDEINKKYFDENKNEPFEFIKKIKYYTHKKSCKKSEVKKLPVNNLSFVKEMIMRGENVVLKKDMKVMITENIDVENGICNGTTGYIIEINKENEKYIISVLTKENKKLTFQIRF